VAGSPFGSGSEPFSIAIDPTGAFAYVADEASDDLSMFAVNASTGALTAVSGSPLSTTSSPLGVAADPEGRFIYVGDVTAENSVSSYSITPTSGTLAVASTVASGGTLPISLAVDPSGAYLYAANRTANTVSVFSIDSGSGTLTAIPGSPFPAGGQPSAVAID
jgi:6-phosphogluconolactonase (cycloisomerase 2 family)